MDVLQRMGGCCGVGGYRTRRARSHVRFLAQPAARCAAAPQLAMPGAAIATWDCGTAVRVTVELRKAQLYPRKLKQQHISRSKINGNWGLSGPCLLV